MASKSNRVVNFVWRRRSKQIRKHAHYFEQFFRKRKPHPSLENRAKRFASENSWVGDFRATLTHLALGQHWIRVADREGNVLSAELSTRDAGYTLDLCQDQWDVARQYLGRVFALTPEQFEIARVLFKDGLSLDSSIEAAKRL
jgi:hypothetical protein